MKTIFKFNYNIICDNISVKMYDCEEVGAAYESCDTGRKFLKNSLNVLKKVDGGYEMLTDSHEKGMVNFTQKIINAMEDTMEQCKIKAGECRLISERVKARQRVHLNTNKEDQNEE